MRIAYLVNQYPKTSHSFIRREILALESLGVSIVRYTLRPSIEELVDPFDQKEAEKTSIVISRPYSTRMIGAIHAALAHPLRFAGAFLQAISLGIRSDRSFALHLAYLAEAAVVSAWCKRDRVSHLHVHFGTNSATVGMLVSKIIGIPWSFTAHGPEEFDRPFGIALAEKIASAKFVVAISSFGRSQLWRWTDHRQWHKVHVVRCGVDGRFLDGKRKSIPKQPRFVCVGRLCEQKGQLLLVDAGRKLRDAGLAFTLVLAGDGPLRGEIEEAIKTAALESHISITGWISGQRVREEIEKARALVLPSFAEGLPVVIMEAMALERPVISTSVAGIPELVVAGKTGWLTPAGDVDALVKAMREVLSLGPATLAAMGKQARTQVLERHNAKTAAAHLSDLFQWKGA